MPPHVYSLGYVSGCMSPHVCGLQSCERACAWSETVDSGHVMKPEASPFCNPQSCRQADCGEGTSTTWGVSTPAESPTSSLAILRWHRNDGGICGGVSLLLFCRQVVGEVWGGRASAFMDCAFCGRPRWGRCRGAGHPVVSLSA